MKMVFTRRFEAAHRLMSDKSLKCQNPHGHSWTVKVTVEAVAPQPLDLQVNMVEEFGAAKKKWHTWIDEYVDHSVMFNINDVELIDTIRRLVPHTKMMLTPGDPTTEMCCALFMAKFNRFLEVEHNSRLLCTRIELIETPTNTVVFEGNSYTHLPAVPIGEAWWSRDDMSTNDLV